jgi:hypothetical protein
MEMVGVDVTLCVSPETGGVQVPFSPHAGQVLTVLCPVEVGPHTQEATRVGLRHSPLVAPEVVGGGTVWPSLW